ncbi:MAG: hypothetical protein AWU57_1492 [Marinobacter sp. T13-3]|nr:MAG: hypothetical protein AWU57_1492 [Marinobacter sp. T13-3]
MTDRERLIAEFAKEGLDFEAEERRWDSRQVMSFNLGFTPPEQIQMLSGKAWVEVIAESSAFLGESGPEIEILGVGLVPLSCIRKSDPEEDIREIERITRGRSLAAFKA